jgi:hypothetical protein
MDAAPVRVRMSAKQALRRALIGFVALIITVTFVVRDSDGVAMSELDIAGPPDLQVRGKAAFRVQLFAIMLTGYEAELHSPVRVREHRRGSN